MADLAAWHAQAREVRGLIISESSKVRYIRSIIRCFSWLWKFYPALFTPEFVDLLDDKDTGPTRDEIKKFIDHPPSELNVKPIFFQHLKIEQQWLPAKECGRPSLCTQTFISYLSRTSNWESNCWSDWFVFHYRYYDHYMSYLLCSNLHGICRCCYHFRDSWFFLKKLETYKGIQRQNA